MAGESLLGRNPDLAGIELVRGDAVFLDELLDLKGISVGAMGRDLV
jgi:hypothetical protein